jgi:hypothetical protein
MTAGTKWCTKKHVCVLCAPLKHVPTQADNPLVNGKPCVICGKIWTGILQPVVMDDNGHYHIVRHPAEPVNKINVKVHVSAGVGVSRIPVLTPVPVDVVETHQDQALNIGKPSPAPSLNHYPFVTLQVGYVYDYTHNSNPFVCTHVGTNGCTIMFLNGHTLSVQLGMYACKKVADSLTDYIKDLLVKERSY